MKNAYESPLWRERAEGMHPGGRDLTLHLLASADRTPPHRILDVGCGNGATLRHLASLGYVGTGIDPSALLIEEAKTRSVGLCIQFDCADAGALPYAAGSFDAVLFECTLSEIARQMPLDVALAEAHRVLTAGGQLLLNDLYAKHPTPTLPDRAAWENAVRSARFVDVAFEARDDDLRRFAAVLIWQGLDVSEWLCGCACGTAIAPRDLGYMALWAAKPTTI